MSPYRCRRDQSGQRPRNPAAALPVVISGTDAIHLYGLDIIAEQLAGADRYYYVHDGLGSVRHPSTGPMTPAPLEPRWSAP